VSARAWTVFAAVSVVWGTPYLFIKIAVDGGMPPVGLAWARVTLAALMLLGIAWRSGTLPSLRGHRRWLAVYALAELAIPLPLIAVGERTVASSTAAIVIATTPLIIAVLAIRFAPSERVDRRRLVGLLVGLAGVAALVGIDLASSPGQLLGTAAFFLAAVGYAIGPLVLSRHLTDLDPIAAMGASMGIAAVILLPMAAISLPAAAPSDGAIASAVVLGLLCTGTAMVLAAVLIKEAGPGRALVVTYVNPVIAVGLGVVFLGETPGAGAVAGLLLILAGSWLSTDGRLPPGLMRILRQTSRLAGRWRPQPRARSESSSPSPGSTGTTAAPRSSPAPCATPAWR
jgi:drug/metabolite transporter (DMT)-like permease